MRRKIDQRGFGAVEAVLIIVIVGILGFTGWFVWHSKHTTNTDLSSGKSQNSASITSFEQCKKASGSKLLETFPEQCVTKSGKSFTAPSQTQTEAYLTITEWRVKLPLTSGIKDASYTISSSGIVHVTTKQLTNLAAKVNGCRAGIDDIYLQRVTSNEKGGVHIGSYYYLQYHANEMACVSENTPEGEQIGVIQQELSAAIEKVVAN